jgi:hypothetical protein
MEGPRTRTRAGGREARGGEGQTATHTKRQHKHHNACPILVAVLWLAKKLEHQGRLREHTKNSNCQARLGTRPTAYKTAILSKPSAKQARTSAEPISNPTAAKTKGPPDGCQLGRQRRARRGRPITIKTEQMLRRAGRSTEKSTPERHQDGIEFESK